MKSGKIYFLLSGPSTKMKPSGIQLGLDSLLDDIFKIKIKMRDES
jgi:hypothetical protein